MNDLKGQEPQYMDLWLAYLAPYKLSQLKVGVRPVVVVSGRDTEQSSQTVTIVPLNSKPEQRQLAPQVLVRHKGIRHTSRALCEQVMTLDRRHLLRHIDTLEGDWFTKLSIQCAPSIQPGMIA